MKRRAFITLLGGAARLRDALRMRGAVAARPGPNLGLRRWDDPSGWIGTEPGPTVSSFDDRARHSLPNS
jgi:hypothetical protein